MLSIGATPGIIVVPGIKSKLDSELVNVMLDDWVIILPDGGAKVERGVLKVMINDVRVVFLVPGRGT